MGRGSRAICYCFLINAAFDMIIESDFCISFLLIIYKNVLDNWHRVVQKRYPAASWWAVRVMMGSSALMPLGRPKLLGSSGGFLGSSTSLSAGMGVRASSGGWQQLSALGVLVPCAGMCRAGGRRTRGCPPWVIPASSEGVGGVQRCVLGLLRSDERPGSEQPLTSTRGCSR